MSLIISVLSDIFLWGTIPLFGAAGYFEHRFNLSQTAHTLLLIALTILMFSWAYFWFRIGEQQRLLRYLEQARNNRDHIQIITPVQMDYRAATDRASQARQGDYAAHD